MYQLYYMCLFWDKRISTGICKLMMSCGGLLHVHDRCTDTFIHLLIAETSERRLLHLATSMLPLPCVAYIAQQ